MFKWYLTAWKKYLVFGGRASLPEFLVFTSTNIVILAALVFADENLSSSTVSLYGVLCGLYGLAVALPTLAVVVRRLHDHWRSGWWYLILLFPIPGVMAFCAWLAQDGDPGENKYGPKPKLFTATVVCLFCAEEHKAWATVCKHCGTDLPKLTISHD